MALPSSGSISLSQVNTELGNSATAPISLNDTNVRTLAGKASGAISLNDLLGKSAGGSITFTPTPGSYVESDGGLGTSVSLTVSASASVVWTWTRTGDVASSSVPTGGTASSITFTLGADSSDRFTTFTVNADGKSWSISLSTTGSGGGGGTV